MPRWMKLSGWSALILLVASAGAMVFARGPPVDQTLVRVATWLGGFGFICGLIFLRSLWSWARWKFRAGAWRAGGRNKQRAYSQHAHRGAMKRTRLAEKQYADTGRWFEWQHGQPAFAQGKYRGQPLSDVAKTFPDYLQWMLKLDLPSDTRGMVAQALNEEFPKRES